MTGSTYQNAKERLGYPLPYLRGAKARACTASVHRHDSRQRSQVLSVKLLEFLKLNCTRTVKGRNVVGRNPLSKRNNVAMRYLGQQVKNPYWLWTRAITQECRWHQMVAIRAQAWSNPDAARQKRQCKYWWNHHVYVHNATVNCCAYTHQVDTHQDWLLEGGFVLY